MAMFASLSPLAVVFGLLARAVELQRALRSGRVGTLEDPVLPGREAREDLGLHRLGAGEAQVGFHADQPVGREAGALLDRETDLVLPVDVVGREGDEAELVGGLGVDRLAETVLE